MRSAVSLVGFVVALVAAALIAPAGAQSSDVRNDVQIGLELLTYVPSGDDQTCLLRTADDIANDPLIAPFASRRGGQGGGDRLCWFDASGIVTMLWTDNSQAVVVEAARSDGDAEALIGFYQDDAGPLANRALAKRIG